MKICVISLVVPLLLCTPAFGNPLADQTDSPFITRIALAASDSAATGLSDGMLSSGGHWSDDSAEQHAKVPEPAAMAMMFGGVVVVGVHRYRKRQLLRGREV